MLVPSYSDWSTHGSPQVLPRTPGPCDIYSAAGIPCVAAHSVVRALYANYTGPLYRVSRSSDMASLNIEHAPWKRSGQRLGAGCLLQRHGVPHTATV
jgi:hypothetical protein